MNCEHPLLAEPPPGHTLPICLLCCKRVITCTFCSATITAAPDIADSYACPRHADV